MLVISRKVGESVEIGDNVTVTVHRNEGSKVRLAIDAPKSVRIKRSELPSPKKETDVNEYTEKKIMQEVIDMKESELLFKYQKMCETTESSQVPEFDNVTARIAHGVIGNSTEAGEMMDNLKRHMFYGQPLDIPNLIEEMGDCLWYLATICNALNITLAQVISMNVKKLKKKRYPDGFTNQAAVDRDTSAEREVFEDSPDYDPGPCDID